MTVKKSTVLSLDTRYGPQSPGQNPIKILISADGKDFIALNPLPFENRAFAGQMFLGVRRRFKQEKMDRLLDRACLPAKCERRPSQRCEVFKPGQASFFLDFAQSRLHQRFSPFLMSFGESPAIERVFDEKNLYIMTPPTEDYPAG